MMLLNVFYTPRNVKLASCPWGAATANGADTLNKMYEIYCFPDSGFHTIFTLEYPLQNSL